MKSMKVSAGSDSGSSLGERYASAEMRDNFAVIRRYILWRRLWLELAKTQKKLGIAIPAKAISEMRRNVSKINLSKAREIELETNHEVVAHIKLFATQCPSAGKIIHLGATSAFVTDNADLIQIRDALLIVRRRVESVVKLLMKLSAKYRSTPIVGYTHFQPAQITTLGKRFSLWLQDILEDLNLLKFILAGLPFLGSKGAVGTQASQLAIFGNNAAKARKLDMLLAGSFGFKRVVITSGQTYSRQIDSRVAYLLTSIAQSASKFSYDLRLLQHTGEVKEPFSKTQVGSSAMPYKQNPVYAERISSLARYVISLSQFFHYTHATQWLERSLDDSAGRRVAIPQIFMAIDAVLLLYEKILNGITIDKSVIDRRVGEQLPLAASEYIISTSSVSGEDRQALHEEFRKLFRVNGGPDPAKLDELKRKNPAAFSVRSHIGNAPLQIDELIKEGRRILSM